MARGRRNQPAEVKAAKGNPGKRPNPVTATEDLPALDQQIPGELQGHGVNIYKDLVRQLDHINLLRMTDRHLLTRYCDTLNEFWKVTRRLRKGTNAGGGYTYEAETTKGGTMLRLNPLFTVQERLSKRLDNMEERLGLSPRARQEILYRLASSAPNQPSLPNMSDQHSGSTTGTGSAPQSSPVGFLNASHDTKH